MTASLSPMDLSACNTLALPCTAREVHEITTQSDLQECYDSGLFQRQPFILGEGSNVILPDNLARPVLRLRNTTIAYQRGADENEDSTFTGHDLNDVLVIADGGVNWDALVAETVNAGWRGLENLSLIPGSVGAAPVQNIGAYGVELADVFAWAEVFDGETGAYFKMAKQVCQFAYRDSLFKRQPGRYCIVRVALHLSRSKPFELSYRGLESLTGSNLSVKDVRDRVIALRRSKLPDPAALPNAGSFFKNPIVGSTHYRELLANYPDIVAYPQDEPGSSRATYKLAAGWLIERAGFKGLQERCVGMHAQQALVLVNYGGASQDDVLSLADEVQEKVAQLFGVQLEIEPVVIRG